MYKRQRLFQSPRASGPLVAVAVPVQRHGLQTGVLVMNFEAGQFLADLERLPMQPGWSLALRDAGGAPIAWRGDSAPASDGQPPLSQPLAGAPWTVALQIPHQAYVAPVWEAAAVVALGVLVATGAGVLGARRVSRRLEAEVAALAAAPSTGLPAPTIHEVATVRRLIDASRAQRDRSEQALRASQAAALQDQQAARLAALGGRDNAYSIEHCCRHGVFDLPQDSAEWLMPLVGAGAPGRHRQARDGLNRPPTRCAAACSALAS